MNVLNNLYRFWLILKNGKSIKDTIVLGTVGGFLGSVAMTLSNFLIFKAGKTEMLYGHLAGSILMKPFKTNKRKNFILGQILHLVNGSGAGLLTVQIFKLFGTDYALLKGTMTGMITWQFLYNVGQRLKIYRADPHLTKTGYSALWNNFVYGLVAAYSVKWLAHPSVFPDSKHKFSRQNKLDFMSKQSYQNPIPEQAEKHNTDSGPVFH